MLEGLSRIEQPILDQSQHEENAHCLLMAYYSQQRVSLTYYERGYLRSIEGEIDKINEAYR